MGRLLLIAMMGLAALLGSAGDGLAQRINPLTGKPLSKEAQEYLERQKAEDARMDAANDIARAEEDALRASKAEQIAADDARTAQWMKDHPSPPGTTEALVSPSYGDDYVLERTKITYFNKSGIPTHTVELGPDGEALGPVTQTQQGKAWETIGPRRTPGKPTAVTYGRDENNEEVIRRATIPGPDGRTVAEYEFNDEGIPWRGETFDPVTGQRTGGFLDERLKPKERTLGGPLDVPPTVRLITGVCEKCRPLVNRHNDLASQVNAIIVEMQSQSAQHQKAYAPAQGPIKIRFAVLKARLDALMPQYEAARRAALDCDKTCREAPKKEPARPVAEEPFESILDSIEDPTAMPPRHESILDDIEEPARPTPSAAPPPVAPTKDAYPPTDEDLEKVMALAQAYLDAANCDGMKCPKIDCPEAQRALQALIDMEFYVKQTVFYAEQADADHMAHLKALAESNLLNGQQRDLLIRVIAIQEFYHNFGSMLLDIASIMSFFKDIAKDGGDEKSALEIIDKINDLYELAKDAESLSATKIEATGGGKAATPIADAVNVAGGVDAGSINDMTSNITDIKSVAVSAREIYEDAKKNGKDWRQEFKKAGIMADLGQLAGRYLKGWSAENLRERQQRMNDLLRDAEAGDIVQAQAYRELQRAQRRRWAAVDALAAVQDARAAYQGCVTKVCGLMSVSPPIIPEFEHVVAGTDTTKYDWGAALRWLNGAIAQTIPKLRPVAFTDDCPEEDQPRADPRLPPEAARPPLTALSDPSVPASFCTQIEKVNYLSNVYNPAAATALANSQAAQAHLGKLNGLFTRYMRTEGGPVWAAIRTELAAYTPIAAEAYAQSNRVNALYNTIMAVPVTDCPQMADNTLVPSTGQPLTPVNDPVPPPATGKPDCPPEDKRKPIVVGPNSKVGSGARLRAKAASTAMGIAGGLLGGALPGAGGGGGGSGGGGSGSGGPPTVVCKIKDGEMTVFNDPATGVSLKVGAKRAGGTVVVFAEIAKSPDNGTFQTAFMEGPQGETMAPSKVDICDLWGEWKLTVSWTKTTYVDGQVVSRESGGWSKTGLFKIPGVLSTTQAPDGLWKRLGFSNASHGARKIAMQYQLPAGGGPVDAVIHVTRPGGDPVTTVPFALRMVEGPNGFTFTKAPEVPCPPGLTQVRDGPVIAPAPAASNPAATTAKPPPPAGQTTAKPPKTASDLKQFEHESDLRHVYTREALDELRREGGACTPHALERWTENRDDWIDSMSKYRRELDNTVATGRMADSIRDAMEAEKAWLDERIKEFRALTPPTCPVEPERTPSILDSIPEVQVIS
jgi:hypothetical protein